MVALVYVAVVSSHLHDEGLHFFLGSGDSLVCAVALGNGISDLGEDGGARPQGGLVPAGYVTKEALNVPLDEGFL
jgi:hypothetical protein